LETTATKNKGRTVGEKLIDLAKAGSAAQTIEFDAGI
jgi:hypothetical protein